MDAARDSPDMQGRWIPDEDWIRKIKENESSDTTPERLNRGMNSLYPPVNGIFRDELTGLRIASCRVKLTTTKSTCK